MKGQVQTVLGPIAPADLGVTITHEHLLSTMPHVTDPPPEDPARRAFFDLPVTQEILGPLRFGSLLNYDNCQLDSLETAIDEVSRFGRAGGDTIVDATSLGLGRNPAGLARIAEASGVNLIMGASYYLDRTHPPERNVAGRDDEDIADEIVRDLTEGADGTSIRSGLIGEVGCSCPLTDNERKVLRASARAQRRTGAPLMTHPSPPQESPMENRARAGGSRRRSLSHHHVPHRPHHRLAGRARGAGPHRLRESSTTCSGSRTRTTPTRCASTCRPTHSGRTGSRGSSNVGTAIEW